ncbi:four helix bundle protein [Roseivirga sp.]|uniref:four helix bundle protein n=1 Tax=Roseivirga sp. TaxID=1964215 RepID=UPI003B51E69B
MHNFRELKVWQKSRLLVKEVYILTAEYPTTEKYNLCSQMQSCAVSIPSNIAEGSGRSTDVDFARFLDISMGSSHELESQLFLSFDLGYVSQEKLDLFLEMVWEVQKMITGLINKLRGKQ